MMKFASALLTLFLGLPAMGQETTSTSLESLWWGLGDTERVTELRFSPDSKLLASAGYGGVIQLFDAVTGAVVQKLIGHPRLVKGLCFSPDGKLLYSASWDGTVRKWDVHSGKQLKSHHMTWRPTDPRPEQPDGRFLIFSLAIGGPGGKILAAGLDHEIAIFRLPALQDNTRLAGHPGIWRNMNVQSVGVKCLSFNPEGTRLASVSTDTAVRVWDIKTGKELRTMKGHTNGLHAVAYSPDGKTIASGGDDRLVKLWDEATGKEIQSLSGHDIAIQSIAFSPSGRFLISADRKEMPSSPDPKTIRIWDLVTGKPVTLGQDVLNDTVAFNGDGTLLAAGGPRAQVSVWRWSTATESNK